MMDLDLENRLEADGQRWRTVVVEAPSLDAAFDRIGADGARRPRVWLLAAASIVIVMGIALIPILIRNDKTSPAAPVAAPSAPLACPATVGPSSPPAVPEPPAGVDGRSRLVPTQAPDRVVICAYEHAADAATTARALTGSRVLTGDGSGLAKELSALRAKKQNEHRACTLIGNLTVTDFLVGLNYPTGTVWVSTATDGNQCVDSSNGVFTTSTYLGARVSQWFAAGSWSK